MHQTSLSGHAPLTFGLCKIPQSNLIEKLKQYKISNLAPLLYN